MTFDAHITPKGYGWAYSLSISACHVRQDVWTYRWTLRISVRLYRANAAVEFLLWKARRL